MFINHHVSYPSDHDGADLVGTLCYTFIGLMCFFHISALLSHSLPWCHWKLPLFPGWLIEPHRAWKFLWETDFFNFRCSAVCFGASSRAVWVIVFVVGIFLMKSMAMYFFFLPGRKCWRNSQNMKMEFGRFPFWFCFIHRNDAGVIWRNCDHLYIFFNRAYRIVFKSNSLRNIGEVCFEFFFYWKKNNFQKVAKPRRIW